MNTRADNTNYNVVILGDTHYDTEPADVYHSNYVENVEWLNRVQHEEFARNGEMWRDRCPRLLKRAACNIDDATAFVLQTGDLIQGDCGSATVHRKMLDDVLSHFKKTLGGLPFVTVIGNHDVRGHDAVSDYGRNAYVDYMPERMSLELGKKITKTTFSFRQGPDAWIVVDFHRPDDEEIARLLEEAADARYTFVVVHAPVLPFDLGSCKWYLHGFDEDPSARNRLRELFAKRNAIVLCGHTHAVEFADWSGYGGRITQLTMNSVWLPNYGDALEYHSTKPSEYGFFHMVGKPKDEPDTCADLFNELRPGLTRYFSAAGAGSFKLNVTDKGVTADFFCGDSKSVTESWTLV